MKLRDPFPAPPFTHRFSALALAQGKPQKTPRTHTCEHMCAQCCSGMVSASTTPGHKAYLKHNLTQCVCWWGMGGGTFPTPSRAPCSWPLQKPWIDPPHLEPRFSTLLANRLPFRGWVDCWQNPEKCTKKHEFSGKFPGTPSPISPHPLLPPQPLEPVDSRARNQALHT